jgi:hypothetical protein
MDGSLAAGSCWLALLAGVAAAAGQAVGVWRSLACPLFGGPAPSLRTTTPSSFMIHSLGLPHKERSCLPNRTLLRGARAAAAAAAAAPRSRWPALRGAAGGASAPAPSEPCLPCACHMPLSKDRSSNWWVHAAPRHGWRATPHATACLPSVFRCLPQSPSVRGVSTFSPFCPPSLSVAFAIGAGARRARVCRRASHNTLRPL